MKIFAQASNQSDLDLRSDEKARKEGVVKVYPIECFVQQQQLKFLLKVLHLEDDALQKIILHGQLDKSLSIGRTGHKLMYKQCIIEALSDFNVTMQQCIDTAKRDWATLVKETGMDAAVCNWEKRPRAAKPIDTDWKTAGRTPVKRKATKVGEVVAVSVVENLNSDGEGRNDEESASERSEDEEEFIHIQEVQ